MPNATAITLERPGTLADRLVAPRLLTDALLVVGGALLVALSAMIAIPMPSGVPITGQTFAVLLVAAALGLRRGTLSMGLYLVLGVIGLPVFAVASPVVTIGYLIGFILCAMIVGALADRGWDRSVRRTIAMMSLGTAAIFVCGAGWGLGWALVTSPASLAEHAGLLSFVAWSFVIPYLPGAAIKIALAAALLPAAWKLVGRDR